MSPETNQPLTEHFAWLERLASRLTRDPDRANDLVQDTWVAALRAERRGIASPRGFLRKLMHRTLWRRLESERRRSDHEALVAARPEAPAASDALERAELGHELTRFVLELDEPYRSVVLLRYADDLTPSQIAERTSLPIATVKSRLARARTMLRDRWLREKGSGLDWLPSLAWVVPAVTRVRAESARLLPHTLCTAAVVNMKLIVAVAGALACGAALWSISRTPDTSVARTAGEAVEREAPGHDFAAVAGAETEAPVERRSGGRTSRALEAAEGAGRNDGAASEPAAMRLFRGRVVDPERRPVVGIDVTLTNGDSERARIATDSTGRFEFEAKPGPGTIRVDDPSVVNLFEFHAEGGGEFDALLVVAPFRALGGVVLDEAGATVAGARAEFVYPPGFRGRFDAVFDAADELRPAIATDEFGRFALENVPIIDGSAVRASLDGFEATDIDAPPYEARELELVLRRAEPEDGSMGGIVVDGRGVPVAGALVSLGHLAVSTGPDGRFRIATDEPVDAREVTAIAAGHLPARYVAELDAATGKALFPAELELQLGGEPLELAGTVVGEDGEPREGIVLWIDDPTGFGTIGDDLYTHLEFLAAPEDSTYSPTSDAYYRTVETDAAGRFKIQGLLDREYTLKMIDGERLHIVLAGRFAAGRNDLELVMPDAESGAVMGRLVTGAGAPVAGVRVDLRAHKFGGVSHVLGPIVTDEDGRFIFYDVVGEELTLMARGEHVLPMHQSLLRSEGQRDITVEVLCHFKVDLAGSGVTAQHVGALDAEGNQMDLYRIGAGGYLCTTRLRFEGEASSAIGVCDRATTVVLFDEGHEVARVPVTLVPGQVVIARP